MHKTVQLSIGELNPHLLCVLCSGYLVDATTIIECLHSFCRSCIVRYLETSKYCPICDVQIHKTKPLLNIRSDKTLQDIVYKLVPALFKDEMKRRRSFYADHPDQAKRLNNREELGCVNECHRIYTEDEKLSVCLQHCVRLPPYHNGSSFSGQGRKDTGSTGEERFLLCPAAMTVGLVKKFIRLKFELNPKYQVEVFHSDETLKDDYTLMDVAYIYAWRMAEPLKLYYIVFDCTKFVLDHGGTESDSSLLTDPGGGASSSAGMSSARRRKKIKGRRHKLGSNEDSDSPSECTATPSYVLRPIDMVRRPKKQDQPKTETESQSETPPVSTESSQTVVTASCSKDSDINSDKIDESTIIVKLEQDLDGEPAKPEEAKQRLVAEDVPEDVTMQVEEEVDEEDIPLILLKKKLIEHKEVPDGEDVDDVSSDNGDKRLTSEDCAKTQDDEGDNDDGGGSDSDTTSYEVHSGVEENNVFSDIEENSDTTQTESSGDVKENSEIIPADIVETKSENSVTSKESDTIIEEAKETLDEKQMDMGSVEELEDAKDISLGDTNKENIDQTKETSSCGAKSTVSVPHVTSSSITIIQNPVTMSSVTSCSSSETCISQMISDTTTSSAIISSVSTSTATNITAVRTVYDKSIVSTNTAVNTTAAINSSSNTSLPVNNNYKPLEVKHSNVTLQSNTITASSLNNSQSSPMNIPVDTKPVYLGSHPVSISQISSLLSNQGISYNNSLISVSDHQPIYSQITHSYTEGTQIKKEVVDIKKNIVMGCGRALNGPKVIKQTPSLATELLTQFGADVLQSINPMQKVQTIVEGIKRKRGRPPKDKTKLLAQIKAQQSPAKLPRLLPKGINGASGPFYPHGNTAQQQSSQGNLQPAQLGPVSGNMGSVQPYGCIAAPMNGLPMFGANPMVSLAQLHNNSRMMVPNGPYLQAVGNTLFQNPQGQQQTMVRPMNGHFPNVMLSPTRQGLGQHLDPSAMDTNKTQQLMGNHSNQCLDQPIMPITIAPKMEKVEQ